MVKYLCKDCNFKSINKFDYTRHVKTEKHLSKLKENKIIEEQKNKESLKCQFCGCYFKSTGGMIKHRNKCMIKSNLEKELNWYKEKAENLEDDKKNMTSIATSALSFIATNYNNAPNIQKFNNFELLKTNNSIEFMNLILYKQKHNIFPDHISDILIKHYKKASPEEQSIWNSDVNRLSYIIKDTDKNNLSVWMQDKKGNMLASYAITPILDHIKSNVREHLTELNRKCDQNKYNIHDQDELEMKMYGNQLVDDIENGESAKSIIKCLASHFFLKNRKTGKKVKAKIEIDEESESE